MSTQSQTEYQREYLLRLPMPLAQQYSVAFNGRTESARASSGWSAFDGIIRLAASALVACYLQETAHGQARSAAADRLLSHMYEPSADDWMLLVSALSQHFGTRADAGAHPLGHLYAQLNQPRNDSPGLLALYRWVTSSAGDQPVEESELTLRRVLHAVTDYRPKQPETIDVTVVEEDLDEMLSAALNEILDEGQLDLLGPPGTSLIWIEDVKMLNENHSEVHASDLIGIHGERIEPIKVAADQAALLVPQRVALLWPGRPSPLPLDPMLHFHEVDLRPEVLFLRRSTPEYVEMHSYVGRQNIRTPGLKRSMARLMSRVSGGFMDQSPLTTLSDPEPESVTLDLQTDQIRVRLLELPGRDLPSQWVFNTSDVITIGREKTNNVILLNPRVSRHHAVISFDGESWQYANKGSNGTLISGQRVDEFELSDGAIVQLAVSGPRVQFDLGCQS